MNPRATNSGATNRRATNCRTTSRWLALLCLCACAAQAADDSPEQPSDQPTDNPRGRLLLTIADPGLAHATAAGPSRPGYSRRSGDYLIGLQVRRAADRLAREFDLEIVEEWPIGPLDVHCLVLETRAGEDLDSLLTALRAKPEVESVQRLNRFQVLGAPAAPGADPYLPLQHNYAELELAEAHHWSRGAGTDVTIIDTGADFSHPELASQVRAHVDFVDAAGGEFERDAHGTAVAGVIAAADGNGVGIVGVAPAARLTILKACWYDATAEAVCDSLTLARALVHAIDARPQVINLSFGGPPDPLLSRLLESAMQRGAVVVAARPPAATPGFPADVPGVIVAGSAIAAGVAAQVLAPGDEILVPTPGGGYDYSSGSSLSAAQVSGIVALMLAMQPTLPRADIDRLLLDSSEARGEYVNACRALARLSGRDGCRHRGGAQASSEAGGQAEYEL